ncbi:MAG: cytochrome c oxidase accessory protein CcoG [Candidatus Limnocylindria bacterium]|jgi:cytochrome c oxidase accessory protein FixG
MWTARPVEGFFRRLRWAADGILIAILLLVPWIEIAGEPLVRFDVPARKFHVFGLVIFPQELYFLWLIVIGLALSLFFFTTLAGRLWCGWACPQTVITDVYDGIARFIQGWSRGAPPKQVAGWRKLATHAVWILLAALLGFHLVAYFVSPGRLLEGALAGTLSPAATGFLLVSTTLAYLDFALVRQTFCKYLCPYARFQGVLFDSDTLVIGYDAKRGEPRGKLGKAAGDCVDCGLCVAVCPTGIDIRKGLQLECIACTHCIDACNGVMESVGRPANLIGYRSLVGLERLRPVRIVRPRVVVYGALLALVGAAFAWALEVREPLDLQVAHNASVLFGATADGRVSNSFSLHIENRDREAHDFRIRLQAPPGFELLVGQNPLRVEALGSVQAQVFVVSAAAGAGAPLSALRFVLERADQPERSVARTANFLFAPGVADGR